MAIARRPTTLPGKWKWTDDYRDSKDEIAQVILDYIDPESFLDFDDYEEDGWTVRDPDGHLYDVVVEVRLEARNAT